MTRIVQQPEAWFSCWLCCAAVVSYNLLEADCWEELDTLSLADTYDQPPQTYTDMYICEMFGASTVMMYSIALRWLHSLLPGMVVPAPGRWQQDDYCSAGGDICSCWQHSVLGNARIRRFEFVFSSTGTEGHFLSYLRDAILFLWVLCVLSV
jgi:hypothetical protein